MWFYQLFERNIEGTQSNIISLGTQSNIMTH